MHARHNAQLCGAQWMQNRDLREEKTPRKAGVLSRSTRIEEPWENIEGCALGQQSPIGGQWNTGGP